MLDTRYIRSIELITEKIENHNEYPFCLSAVRNINNFDFHPHITFLVGENGSGKSTLLEAIATQYGFNPEGGSKNFAFSTQNSHSELHNFLRIIKGIKKPKDGYFLRAESYYNVATNIDNLDKEPGGTRVIESYGGTSLHKQSHGESFLSLFEHRLFGNGIYIFDEPESALSPKKQIILLQKINQLVKKDSQFIIATHSPILLAFPDAKIYQISKADIKELTYMETDHYKLYKSFLDNPEDILVKNGIF